MVLAIQGAQPSLRASNPEIVDSDRDGLPDAQEVVLGTSPFLADTDFDGWSDGEEVALQSSPFSALEVPGNVGSALSVGMSARGECGKVHLLAAVHIPDGVLDDKIVRFVLMRNGALLSVSTERLIAMSKMELAPGLGGGLVATFDIGLPPLHVHTAGAVTWAVVVGREGDLRYHSAAVVDLVSNEGVVLWRRRGHLLPPNIGNSPIEQFQGDTGGVHQPIPPGGTGEVPLSWQPGQVCFQRSEVVGFNAPYVVSQIIDAQCVEGWDSFCDTDCPGTVGTTFETLDPGALIGG
jgi:hypothetical protein